jgi:hypothetical protein
VGSVTTRAIQSRHASTEFRLIPQVKRAHAWAQSSLPAAVTGAIRGLNKSGTLNEIENLPKRWDAVNEKQGDYLEGL